MASNKSSSFKASVKRGLLRLAGANPPALALLGFGLLAAVIYWVEAAQFGYLGDVVFFLSTAVLFTCFGYLIAGLSGAFQLSRKLDKAGIPEGVRGRAINGELTMAALADEYLHANQQFSLLETHYKQATKRLDCIESCLDGFVVIGDIKPNEGFQPLYLGENLERHLGLKRKSLLENWAGLYKSIDAKDQAAVQAVLARTSVFPSKEKITFALQRSAHEAPSYYTLSVIRQAASDGVTIFAVITDSTEHTEAVRQAKSEDKAKSEFLATVSHELRTPLNAIIGFSRLLVSQLKENSEARSDAQNIVAAGESLHVILNDVLDYSRISAEGMKLNNEPFELRALVRGLYEINHITAENKGIELRLKEEIDENPVLLGDVNRLRQVVQNLLSNALKFTESGYVELFVQTTTSETRRTQLTIRLTDTGIGISKTELRRLFTRFGQANRETNRRFGGTGLGLAISKGLIEMMGGKIDVTSEPGVGSVFEISLSLATTDRPVNNASAIEQDIQSLRILGVDDHPLNLKLLDKFLSKKGHQFDCANSGKQALQMADENAYDLILMDIDMPEMDGYQATQALRAKSVFNSHTYICALSGLADEASMAKSKEVGMNEHLTKPVSFDALNRVLQGISSNVKLEAHKA